MDGGPQQRRRPVNIQDRIQLRDRLYRSENFWGLYPAELKTTHSPIDNQYFRRFVVDTAIPLINGPLLEDEPNELFEFIHGDVQIEHINININLRQEIREKMEAVFGTLPMVSGHHIIHLREMADDTLNAIFETKILEEVFSNDWLETARLVFMANVRSGVLQLAVPQVDANLCPSQHFAFSLTFEGVMGVMPSLNAALLLLCLQARPQAELGLEIVTARFANSRETGTYFLLPNPQEPQTSFLYFARAFGANATARRAARADASVLRAATHAHARRLYWGVANTPQPPHRMCALLYQRQNQIYTAYCPFDYYFFLRERPRRRNPLQLSETMQLAARKPHLGEDLEMPEEDQTLDFTKAFLAMLLFTVNGNNQPVCRRDALNLIHTYLQVHVNELTATRDSFSALWGQVYTSPDLMRSLRACLAGMCIECSLFPALQRSFAGAHDGLRENVGLPNARNYFMLMAASAYRYNELPEQDRNERFGNANAWNQKRLRANIIYNQIL